MRKRKAILMFGFSVERWKIIRAVVVIGVRRGGREVTIEEGNVILFVKERMGVHSEVKLRFHGDRL